MLVRYSTISFLWTQKTSNKYDNFHNKSLPFTVLKFIGNNKY